MFNNKDNISQKIAGSKLGLSQPYVNWILKNKIGCDFGVFRKPKHTRMDGMPKTHKKSLIG